MVTAAGRYPKQEASGAPAMLSGAIMKSHKESFAADRMHDVLNRNESMRSTPLGDADFLMDKVFVNIGSSPLGKLLEIIANLPEVRTDKVERGRWRAGQSEETLDHEMDAALDKVLEEIITES